MTSRTWSFITVTLMLACAAAFAGAAPAVRQFESDSWSTPENAVDLRVEATLRQHGAHLRNPCSDEVFIRRVYLDMIGTLPQPTEVDAFLADRQSRQTRRVDRFSVHPR